MPNTPVLGLPYPSSADTADVPRDVKALADSLDAQQSFLPIGALILWALAAPPAGNNPSGKAAWLLCNGQQVSATDYPKLAALLGAPGGNVTIPDLSGRVPVGKGPPPFDVIGHQGGELSHLLTAAESGMPGHTHADTFAVAAGTIGQTAGWNVVIANGSLTAGKVYTTTDGIVTRAPIGGSGFGTSTSFSYDGASHTHGLSGAVSAAAAAAAAMAHNNLQPYMTLNFAMRAA